MAFIAVLVAWRVTNALDIKSWDLIVAAVIAGGALDILLS